MDRDAHVRAARRRLALDALAFERDREAVLVEQFQDVLAEAGGPRLDADLFAQMTLDEAQLVRVALGEDAESASEDEETEPENDELAFDEAPETPEDEVEAEVVRLQAEIERSRGVQAALVRYLELLSEQPGAQEGTR